MPNLVGSQNFPAARSLSRFRLSLTTLALYSSHSKICHANSIAAKGHVNPVKRLVECCSLLSTSSWRGELQILSARARELRSTAAEFSRVLSERRCCEQLA